MKCETRLNTANAGFRQFMANKLSAIYMFATGRLSALASSLSLDFIHCLLVAEFSAAFEAFLEDDGRSARAQMQKFDEQLNALIPASSQYQSNIHYVYIYYDDDMRAETPLEFARAVRYIGVGERRRASHHVLSAEEKVALGKEVS